VTERLLGVLGGTFDPVHIGHLRTVMDLQQALNLTEIHLIPNYRPPHRTKPTLTAEQRFDLLEKALMDVPGLVADDREIIRRGASYMVDTLRDLKRQFPQRHLCLIIGTDAYNGFCDWHDWQGILQLAHILVMKRAGVDTAENPELDRLITTDADSLLQVEYGLVYLQQVSQLDVSSTRIREMIMNQQRIQFLVPEVIRLDLENLYKG